MASTSTTRKLRVLIVRKEFWPTISDATLRIIDWCNGLRELGGVATVLAARPSKQWPQRIQLDHLPIIRVDNSSSVRLRPARYGRAVKSWLAAQKDNYDLIYFDEPGEEAAAFFPSYRRREFPPAVMRYDPGALSLTSRTGRRPWRPSRQIVDALGQASAIIAPSAVAHKNLLADGHAHANVKRIADCGAQKLDRSIGARRLARQLLSDTNHELITKSSDRIVLCPGQVNDDWDIGLLLNALGPSTENNRNLCIWILGEGSGHTRFSHQIQQKGWQYSIILPGVFTDIRPLLQAADICVFPNAGVGLSWMIPTCIASHIPFLAVDEENTQAVLGQRHSPLLFAPDSPLELRTKLEEWLQESSTLETELQKVHNNTTATREDRVRGCREFLSLVDPQFANN